jgi:hypothetical protein
MDKQIEKQNNDKSKKFKPRNDKPKNDTKKNDNSKNNDTTKNDKPKNFKPKNDVTDKPKNNNRRSRNNDNRKKNEIRIEKISKIDNDGDFYDLYFKDQERIRLKEIEIEKLYKPPEEWVKKLIPVVFKKN